jgi:hypothetical protein
MYPKKYGVTRQRGCQKKKHFPSGIGVSTSATVPHDVLLRGCFDLFAPGPSAVRLTIGLCRFAPVKSAVVPKIWTVC